MKGAPVSSDSIDKIFANNATKIKAAKEVIAHPPLKKKAITTLLTGLKASIENYDGEETISDIFRLLPSFDTLSAENQTNYVACFIRAVELNNQAVLDKFLSPEYVEQLPGEHLIYGLQVALIVVGGEHPTVAALGAALESFKNFQLNDPLIQTKMFDVLNDLFNKGQSLLATRLLKKHHLPANYILDGLDLPRVAAFDHSATAGFGEALEKCESAELDDLEDKLYGVLKKLFNKGHADLATRLLNKHRISAEYIVQGLNLALAAGGDHPGIVGFGTALENVDGTELDDLEYELYDVLKKLFSKGHSDLATRLLNKHRLSAEYILEGLDLALTAGANHPGILGFGMALENVDSAELGNPAIAEKMYQVLKKLILNGHGEIARILLNKHQNIAQRYFAQLAEFCMQHRQTDMLAYLFLKDPQFDVISLEKLVTGLMRWLPEDETIREEVFAGPFKLLEYILSNAEESLTPEQRRVILMRLQRANEVERFTWMFKANSEDLPTGYLNNRLAYALGNNQTTLVPLIMRACQQSHGPWSIAWSPTYDMFFEVIFRSRVELLPVLLNCAPNDQFIFTLNRALAYAASIGQTGMVHTILERQKALKCTIDRKAVVKVAVENQKRDVVVYLFQNLPGLTLENKMASVDFAPASFRATMVDLVNTQALIEERLKAVVRELPTQGLTDDNVYPCLMKVMNQLEKMRIAGEDPLEAELAPPPLMMGGSPRARAADAMDVDDSIQAKPLPERKKRSKSLGSLYN